MAKLIYGMMQSLDGYVEGPPGGPQLPMPGPDLHRYFNRLVHGLSGSLYGRRMYQLMRYWDEEQADWDATARDFAGAWRALPKWVVSSTLKTVGPNATLISDDVESAVRRLKAEVEGVIEVAGPELAASLTRLEMIDEYHLYVRPTVVGGGKPFFGDSRPNLQLLGSDMLPEETVELVFGRA